MWGRYKNTHPLKESGVGYSHFSIPRFHPGYGSGPSLIDALTGAPGVAFPHTRLGSGIADCSVTDALHHTAPSLGILLPARVFVVAFTKEKIAQFPWKVNGFSGKKPSGKRRFVPVETETGQTIMLV